MINHASPQDTSVAPPRKEVTDVCDERRHAHAGRGREAVPRFSTRVRSRRRRKARPRHGRGGIATVVGLREGGILRLEGSALSFRGLSDDAVLFRHGSAPRTVTKGDDLAFLMRGE